MTNKPTPPDMPVFNPFLHYLAIAAVPQPTKDDPAYRVMLMDRSKPGEPPISVCDCMNEMNVVQAVGDMLNVRLRTLWATIEPGNGTIDPHGNAKAAHRPANGNAPGAVSGDGEE